MITFAPNLKQTTAKTHNKMIEKIEKLMAEIEALQAANAEEAEALRIKYLSKKGEITALMNDFRSVPAAQKKEVGMRINQLKAAALDKINALKSQAAAGSQQCASPARPTPSIWEHAIPSPSYATKLWTSSADWDSRWPKDPKWRTTGTCTAA